MLLSAPGATITILIGLPLLGHLGYTALTSLPMGQIPGRPSGGSEKRRNYALRARVVAFLNEVQRVERYVKRARSGGVPRGELKENLRSAEKRMMTTAAEVVKATGQTGV